MLDHAKSHLISDHVATVGYGFVVPEGVRDDVNEISFDGAW